MSKSAPRLIVYVGCSVTNGSKELENFVVDFKKKLRIATPAIVLEWIGKSPDVTLDNFYLRDFNNVHQCDAFIAIIDEPSIGLGMEIQEALHLRQPVLCLYEHGHVISRLLLSAGTQSVLPVKAYQDVDNAVQIASEFILEVARTKESVTN